MAITIGRIPCAACHTYSPLRADDLDRIRFLHINVNRFLLRIHLGRIALQKSPYYCNFRKAESSWSPRPPRSKGICITSRNSHIIIHVDTSASRYSAVCIVVACTHHADRHSFQTWCLRVSGIRETVAALTPELVLTSRSKPDIIVRGLRPYIRSTLERCQPQQI